MSKVTSIATHQAKTRALMEDVFQDLRSGKAFGIPQPMPAPVLCKGGCGETVLWPRDLCNRCYADIKGPFELERDDGDDE